MIWDTYAFGLWDPKSQEGHDEIDGSKDEICSIGRRQKHDGSRLGYGEVMKPVRQRAEGHVVGPQSV